MTTPTLADREPLIDVLPPSPAGKPRAVKWYKRRPDDKWPCDAVMAIEEAGRGAEPYAVTEDRNAADGRGFSCCKAGSAPYSVFLHRNGQDWSCTCEWATYRGACRHYHGLLSALHNGWVDADPAERPAEWAREYTDAELERMAAEYAAEERAGRLDLVGV